jgi:hypothetical protein
VSEVIGRFENINPTHRWRRHRIALDRRIGRKWLADLPRLGSRPLPRAWPSVDFAAFTGMPGGMPMAFVRCYTGTDGQSHFEDLDLLPPDMERSTTVPGWLRALSYNRATQRLYHQLGFTAVAEKTPHVLFEWQAKR